FYTARSTKDSMLRLKVQHSFREAQITVSVDGDVAYTGKLTGYVKKKYGLFAETVQGSLSQTVAVPSGKHNIRVQITSDDGSSSEDVISGDFTAKNERTLSVSARHGEVSLSWQGGSSATTESSNTSGIIGRYANTLFLTIAGSIISALTGFAVKEVPAYIKSRQEAAPKAESVPASR